MMTAREALALLREGNRRFAANQATSRSVSSRRREARCRGRANPPSCSGARIEVPPNSGPTRLRRFSSSASPAHRRAVPGRQRRFAAARSARAGSSSSPSQCWPRDARDLLESRTTTRNLRRLSTAWAVVETLPEAGSDLMLSRTRPFAPTSAPATTCAGSELPRKIDQEDGCWLPNTTALTGSVALRRRKTATIIAGSSGCSRP